MPVQKIVSIFTLATLLIGNLVPPTAFAASDFSLDEFTLRYNNNNYTTSFGIAPGDTVGMLVGTSNNGDDATNVYAQFSFSSSNITYQNPGTVDTYADFLLERSDIPTTDFNPPSDNTLPITPLSSQGTYNGAYYANIGVPTNFANTSLVLSAQIFADGYGGSNTLQRTVYVNTRPHVTDYRFEKNGSTVTQVAGSGSEAIDLVLTVKDYNGCANIDWGAVTANLTSLGLSSTETLSYLSCAEDGKTATFKKTGITTIAATGTKSFDATSFVARDEDGNANLPSDPDTTFDTEDRTSALSLSVVPPSAPSVSILSVSDADIGSALKTSTTISFSGSLAGEFKITVWTDGTCSTGTVIQDWTGSGSYAANTATGRTIAATSLTEGANTVYVCMRTSSGGTVGSSNTTVTKDTVAPSLSNFLISPASITTGNASASFVCSEAGIYQLEVGGGSYGAGTVLGSGSTSANGTNSMTVLNGSVASGVNTLYSYCLDRAGNVATRTGSLTKITPPPSMSGATLALVDNDIDYNGIDGRDLFATWDSSLGSAYGAFQGYWLYILPSSVTLDTASQNYAAVITPSSTGSWRGTSALTKDATNATLVSGGSYKMCIAIMSNAGQLGTAGCSAATTVTGDIVANPTVLSAKFTGDSNLELTTDATLDTTLSAHSGALVTYVASGVTYTGTAIASVNGTKLNVTVPALSNLAATGGSLVVATGAIHAGGGGYNNYFSSGALVIRDAQAPAITAFATGTVSAYNGFYSGSLSFSFAFGEPMSTDGTTKFVFTRTAGTADSNSPHNAGISDTTLLSSGSHSTLFALSGASLVSGATYSVSLVGADRAGNSTTSAAIAGIKYDASGPAAPTLVTKVLESTLAPTFAWSAAIDDAGNGAGVASYSLLVYSGSSCGGSALRTQTVTGATGATLASALVTNPGDYSWKVVATDNLGNVGTASSCDDFTVNTSVPSLSNAVVTDTTLGSTSYAKTGDAATVSATITQSDAAHIWLDASALTGNGALTAVQCSAPGTGITCNYASNVVTYGFDVGFGGTVPSGVRQVQFTATNTSGGGTGTVVASTTVDNTAPTVSSPFTAPVGGDVIGGTGRTIAWNTANVSDNIGIASVEIAYGQSPFSTWTTIGTGANNGSMAWDLTSVASGDYRLRMIVRDLAQNASTATSGSFTVDKTPPSVGANAVTYPNGGEVIAGNTATNILWNSGSITDAGGLAANPISLAYSLDNGSTWTTIGTGIANVGTYAWTTPNANVSAALVRLTATDVSGNTASDVSNATFVMDATLPSVGITFAGGGGNTPQNGKYINDSGIDVTASATDTYLAAAEYTFQNQTTGQYWNSGSANYGSTAVWNTLCADGVSGGTGLGCSAIVTTIAPTAIANGNSYRLVIRARDEAGNVRSANPVDYVGDVTAPTVTLATASGSYFSATGVVIAGTASDAGAGLASTKISIQKASQWWNGTAWVGSAQLLSTSGTAASWTYSFVPPVGDADGQSYVVTATATDSAFKSGNAASATGTILYDVSGPNVAANIFTFDTGAIRLGNVNFTATWNAGGITATGAALANSPITIKANFGTGIYTVASGLPNSGSYTFVLPGVDVTTAFVQILATDAVGNVSAGVSSQTFTVDTAPPTISSVSTMDRDADGRIDALLVTMSESVPDSTIRTTDFSLGAGIGAPTGIATASASDDNVFELTFSNTGTTATVPNLVYTAGTLADRAGHPLASVTKTSVDMASPRMSAVNAYDDNADGMLDRIAATFSENIAATSTLSGWTLGGAYVGMSLAGASASGSTINIALANATTDTATTGLTLALTNTAYVDAAGNVAGGFAATAVADRAAPVIRSVETRDLDTDGKIDALYVTASEPVSDASVNSGNFSTSYAIGTFVPTANGDTANDAVFYLPLTQTGGVSDTDATPSVTYTRGTLADSAGNLTAAKTLTALDRVAPKPLSKTTADSNADGNIDRIVLHYSEALNGDTSGVTVSVAGYTIASYAATGSDLLVNVDPLAIADGNAAPLVQLTANASAADAAGNLVPTEASATNAADGVGPVILGARYDEGGAGVSDDAIYVTFSEAMNTGSINLSDAAATFVVSGGGSLGTNSPVVILSATTAKITLSGVSAAALTPGVSKISLVTGIAKDLANNAAPTEGAANRATVTASVVINEIMWSSTGSNASQYIELRNLSSASVDVTGWKLANAGGLGTDLTLPSATIGAHGYYLVTKTAVSSAGNLLKDGTVVSDSVQSALSLSASSPNVILKNASSVAIDTAKIAFSPLIGNDAGAISMERSSFPGDGTDSSNWYAAQSGALFDAVGPRGTPRSANVFDATAPVLTTSLVDDTLYPSGGALFSYAYSDTGAMAPSPIANLLIERNDGAGNYSALTGAIASSGVTMTGATYRLASLSAGRYRATFSIQDQAGNAAEKVTNFYVDAFSMSVSATGASLGTLQNGSIKETTEILVTIRTVGAAHALSLTGSGGMSGPGGGLGSWNGTDGFGFDLAQSGSGGSVAYAGSPIVLSGGVIASRAASPDTNGNMKTYVYRVKYVARPGASQAAGAYSAGTRFTGTPTY